LMENSSDPESDDNFGDLMPAPQQKSETVRTQGGSKKKPSKRESTMVNDNPMFAREQPQIEVTNLEDLDTLDVMEAPTQTMTLTMASITRRTTNVDIMDFDSRRPSDNVESQPPRTNEGDNLWSLDDSVIAPVSAVAQVEVRESSSIVDGGSFEKSKRRSSISSKKGDTIVKRPKQRSRSPSVSVKNEESPQTADDVIIVRYDSETSTTPVVARDKVTTGPRPQSAYSEMSKNSKKGMTIKGREGSAYILALQSSPDRKVNTIGGKQKSSYVTPSFLQDESALQHDEETGETLVKIPSLETLAVQLEMPKLLELADQLTPADLLKMNFNDLSEQYQMQPQDYMKLKKLKLELGL
jgi:hypothetical protein